MHVGTRLSHYEIRGALGQGGMGQVWKAFDAILHRDVAIKTLPPEVASDPDRLARFAREARMLATLNHPNVAVIHGLETFGDTPFLVLELIEGDTLEQRLSHGPVPVEQALPLALQIAEALEAAHERGIVHRDLKPANIKLTRDGRVKVLDFGLAKALERDPQTVPTGTIRLSQPGVVMGTASYMSPEQARGEEVGRQADIWSFGVVLYEVLTGVSPFARNTLAETLAQVLSAQPDFTRLPIPLPSSVARLIQRCLEKEPKRRRQHMGDVRIELEDALAALRTDTSSAPFAAVSPATGPIGRRRWLTAGAALSVVALSGLAGWFFGTRASSPAGGLAAAGAIRVAVPAPDNTRFTTHYVSGNGAPIGGSISPDGRMLAFTASDVSGAIRLWIRPLDSLDARALPGTAEASLPFWSPDSSALGFFAQGALKKIDVGGGQPEVLAPIARGQGGTWNRDGVVVFAPALRSGLYRISAAGGEPAVVTTLTDGHVAHRFPHFLPDGKHVLYYAEASRPEQSGVFVTTLGGESRRRVLASDSAAIQARPGYLLFVRQGTLFAQRFDAATVEVTGEPIRIAQSLSFEGSAPAFSASDTGVLTYRTGPADAEQQQLAWFDRNGTRLGLVGPPGPYRGVDLSPDGTRVAVHRHDGTGGDIWIFEPRGTTTRVTFDPARDNASPVWSPDGALLAFGAQRDGKWGLYRKSANGEDDEELLFESDNGKIPASWSPDGRHLVYWHYESGVDQWLLPLHASPAASPAIASRSDPLPSTPFMSSRFSESHSQVSPDNKWVAYVSDRSGRLEVYLRPFPSGEGVWQISTNGGVTPRWRRDGREIYYVTAYDQGTLMAASIDRTGEAAEPRELFAIDTAIVPHSTATQNYHTYAVSPDGQRFLIPSPVSTLGTASPSADITVVLNWTALLEPFAPGVNDNTGR